MSEFVGAEDARSTFERELDYRQAVKRPEPRRRVASAQSAGGDQVRAYLDAKAQYVALERRVATLKARRSRTRPAGGGRRSVGDAGNGAERTRRSDRRQATLDQAVVRSWLRRLGGRSSIRSTTRS